MINIVKDRRGENIEIISMNDAANASGGGGITTSSTNGQILVKANMPWQEVVCDMNDQVKHLSAGYASFDYELNGYQESNLVKVDVAVNSIPCDALSFIIHESKATVIGRNSITKLKQTIKKQQFEIILQAKVGEKVQFLYN